MRQRALEQKEIQQMNTTTLTVGDSAPDFSGIAVGAEFADGKPFRLSDYFDEQIVLYFYPQDQTPGCTAQACKLRADLSLHDLPQRFAKPGVDVFLGEAHVAGPDTVEVAGQTLRFKRVVIATG